MKKSILILSLSLAIAACGGKSSNSGSDTTNTKQDAVAQNSSTDTAGAKNGTEAVGGTSKGESLMASADCNTCHKYDTKLVGPSLKDIAAKYTSADVDKLADKVIKGGSGSWGDVAMTPHPSVSKDDAKAMVAYILTQK